MPRKSMTYLALLILTTVSGSSHAQTTITVNGPSGPIYLFGGTTLNIDSPASVSGSLPPPNSYITILGSAPNTTINMNGGQVIYDIPPVSLGLAILSEGTFTATGGTVQGGVGLLAYGPTQISGGTFIGEGSPAAEILAPIGGNVSISGGTFRGDTAYPAAYGLILSLSTSAQASITGGNFSGGGGGVGFSLSYDGSADTTTDVHGGLFTGAININLNNTSSFLNFFGHNFQLQQIGVDEYQFTGTLADGNPLDVTLSNSGFPPFTSHIKTVGNQEEFVFAGVPEPSSVVMLATGLVGLAAAGAFRRRRHRRMAIA